MRLMTAAQMVFLLGVSGAAFGQAATMACQDESGRDGSCELNSALNASVRIGLTFNDGEDSDADFSVSNFGSRLRWGGETALDNGLTGIGYLEFGINPDENGRGNSGVDRTRQLWAGLRGGFGEVKIGAQYAAFYQMISSHTDIAYWGSCWTQFECARQTRVLKYEGGSGDLSYAASFTGVPDDIDNDIADELEAGVNYDVGGFTVGVAATIQADDTGTIELDDGTAVDVENDGGILLGAVVKGDVGGASVAVGLQLADEDFANAEDDATNLTFAGSLGQAYLVANIGDDGENSPFYATVGYYQNLSPASVLYYEAQIIDDDDGSDETIIGRAVFIYNFDAVVLNPM